MLACICMRSHVHSVERSVLIERWLFAVHPAAPFPARLSSLPGCLTRGPANPTPDVLVFCLPQACSDGRQQWALGERKCVWDNLGA